MSISNRPPPPTSVLNVQNEIPIQIKWKKKYTPSLHWVIPEKKNRRGGIEDVRYGISRGIKEIACGISRGDQEKIMWNFQVVLVFGLGTSKGFNAILHNFLGWSIDLSGISRGKVNKWKFPVGLQKSMSSAPNLFFFGIAHCIWSFEGTSYNDL